MNTTRHRHRRFSMPMTLAVMLCFATSAFGITIEAYKGKVEKARSLAVEIETSMRNSEFDYSQTRFLVEYLRENFQPVERVEWPEGTVETSNQWLLDRAAAFEKETELTKRLPIVTEIREHLSTIAFKLQELEEASTSGRTKDEDKQKLAEILRREEYQKPQAKEESAIARWVRQFLEWLESFFRTPKQPEAASGFGGLGLILQALLFIGLFVLLAFVVYKIVLLIAPTAGRMRKPKKRDRIILGEKLAEDETAVDLLSEAEQLAREGNLRGAIRKGYIALLCELSDRKVLGLARHKTNRDYLRDVRSRRDLHPKMQVVTESFERHWYGFQESGADDWARFRDEYDRAIRSV